MLDISNVNTPAALFEFIKTNTKDANLFAALVEEFTKILNLIKLGQVADPNYGITMSWRAAGLDHDEHGPLAGFTFVFTEDTGDKFGLFLVVEDDTIVQYMDIDNDTPESFEIPN